MPEHYTRPMWTGFINSLPEGFWIAKNDVDGTTIGYIVCKLETKSFLTTDYMNDMKMGLIVSLAVAAPFRRHGIAKHLVTQAVGQMISKDCQGVSLQVRMSNRQAIGLYNGYGFKPVDKIAGYYEDGEMAVIMFKPLVTKKWITKPKGSVPILHRK